MPCLFAIPQVMVAGRGQIPATLHCSSLPRSGWQEQRSHQQACPGLCERPTHPSSFLFIYHRSLCVCRMLMASKELANFGQVRIYLDEDFTCAVKFTSCTTPCYSPPSCVCCCGTHSALTPIVCVWQALGNLYFVHNSLTNIKIWDFKVMCLLCVEKKYVSVEGKEVHSGNIERVSTKEKDKFPQEFFPEKVLYCSHLKTNNLTNIISSILLYVHKSSLPGVSQCKWSRKGFMRTRWCINDTQLDLVNVHLFHDISNFVAMERKITKQASPILVKCATNGDIVKMLYRDPANENKLREFDKELQAFQDQLFEFEVSFPPSYPYEEVEDRENTYMKTRCPAWCDRILLSKSARALVYK
ncbi:INPP5A, partial [Cordylochernes scorpioides]